MPISPGRDNDEKTWLMQASSLLIFHVLNAAVALAGAVFAVLMMVCTLLLPCWIAHILVLDTWFKTTKFVFLRFSEGFWWISLGIFMFTYSSLYILDKLGWFSWILYPFVVGGVNQVFVCCVLLPATLPLVNADIRVAQFIETELQHNTTLGLLTEECAMGFELPVTVEIVFQPLMNMMRWVWKVVLYFAFSKLLVGLRSISVVLLTAVLPVMMLTSGGGSMSRFTENTTANCVTALLLWLAGAMDLVGVAFVSVKWTAHIRNNVIRQSS